MIAYISIASLFVLIYIYWGYGVLLRILWKIYPNESLKSIQRTVPTVTVLVPVYNEVNRIQERLDNIFQCDYSQDKINVVVVSDGSDDGTDDVVLTYENPRVRLIRVERCGKSGAQNRAMKNITSDVVVFTDADVTFDQQFLEKVVQVFDDPCVGAATGHLLFATHSSNGVSKGQGFYWNYELLLRRIESKLGILAVSSGSCLAVRRNLFVPMAEEYGDDCIVPLDIVSRGYKVEFAEGAYTYDEMPSDVSGELRARVRMTLRNWQCTWSFSSLLNPFKFPSIAFSLWSHKILRWMSPFFMIILALGSNLWVLDSRVWPSVALASGVNFFIIISIVGWLASLNGKKVYGASVAFGFLLANYGFLVGVLRALVGDKIRAYSTEQ